MTRFKDIHLEIVIFHQQMVEIVFFHHESIDHYLPPEDIIIDKFHKVVIKITGLRDWTPSKMVNFH